MAESQSSQTGVRGEKARLKDRFAWLNRFTDEELRKLSFCYEGDVLDADGMYFDLNRPEVGPLPMRSGDRVPKGSCLIPQNAVTPTTWDKLIEQPR